MWDLSLSGTFRDEGAAHHGVRFSGIFWLMLLYIPMVISLHLPQASWQVYMDPSYLPMIPFVSDLWLTGIAIWGGKRSRSGYLDNGVSPWGGLPEGGM